MPTPTLKSFDEMREDFEKEFGYTDNGNAYFTDEGLERTVADYWLSVIRERDAEYRRRIEGLSLIP